MLLHTSLLLFAFRLLVRAVKYRSGDVRKKAAAAEFRSTALPRPPPPSTGEFFSAKSIEKLKNIQHVCIIYMYLDVSAVFSTLSHSLQPFAVYFFNFIIHFSPRDFFLPHFAFKSTIAGGPHPNVQLPTLDSFSISHPPTALLIIKHFFSLFSLSPDANCTRKK